MTTVSPSGNTTAAVTYTPIATQTLSSAASSVTFSSIPGTYKDLVLVTQAGLSVNNNSLYMTFNSDTASNYSSTSVEGYTNSYDSYRLSSQSKVMIAGVNIGLATTVGPSMSTSNIMNYSNTTTYKTIVGRWADSNDAGNKESGAVIGLYRSTSAITTINIFSQSGNLASGSVFTLYGIGA